MSEQEQAYVDPVKLQDFSVQLRGFARSTDGALDRLLSALGGLGQSWQDSAFEEFKQHVRGLAQTLMGFVVKAENFSSYLDTKADEAKQIHRMNIP